MKSINNFIGLALLSGALLTSCSDSFLQRDSLTESSSNTFWQTPDDALMALASCYDALQSNQLYNSDQYSLGPLYMDCISDNGGHFNWSGWMEGYDMAMGIHTPSSSIIGSYWKDCYEVISRCNVLIANIDRVDMDASQKAIYQAEAKTIRALMYINLTMTYQDVPFLTAPLTIDEAECEKTDRAAIVAHVMTDLQMRLKYFRKMRLHGDISPKELLFPYWGVWLCIMKNGMTRLLLISRCKVWDTRLIRVMPNCLLKVEKLLLKSFLQSVMKDRV